MHKISKRRVANGTESKGLNLFSQIRGIVEQSLDQLFILIFFIKTDFWQFLLKVFLRLLGPYTVLIIAHVLSHSCSIAHVTCEVTSECD